MPLISACQLPPPTNWQDLESLCADLWREEWKDSNIQRVGRHGQKQDGVDICGRLKNGEWAGIQCKCIRADLVLTEDELRHEVAKAKNFQPQLSQYLIATTGLKDARLERICRHLTDDYSNEGHLTVAMYNWADICLLLQRHPSVAHNHFPFVITSVAPIVLNNEGARLNGMDQVKFSFSREHFVHPRIVEELLGGMSDRHETVVSVDIGSANKSNRFYGDFQIIPESDGAWVECKSESKSSLVRYEPYFRYKHLGTSKSGIHILRTTHGGGGSGHFNDLCFLTFQTDNGLTLTNGALAERERILLKTLGSIPIGDRYIGTIEFKDDVLVVGDDQNSFGCLKEGFSIRVQ